MHVKCVSAGVLPVEELFKDLHICDSLKPKYIQLLEKFEVALSIGASQVEMNPLFKVCFPLLPPFYRFEIFVASPVTRKHHNLLMLLLFLTNLRIRC